MLTGKIVDYSNKRLTIILDKHIDKDLINKEIEEIEIVLNDGRNITSDQRRKIFAIIRDIAIWNGDEPEYIRKFLMFDYRATKDIKQFSLSDTDITTARGFIEYLIGFCFIWNIPTKKPLNQYADDVEQYLYKCLEHKKCAICNANGEIHHVDRVGMGRNREKIVHEGLNAVCLCRKHHTEAHSNEVQLFKKYHIRGILLDKYLCKKLNLRSE